MTEQEREFLRLYRGMTKEQQKKIRAILEQLKAPPSTLGADSNQA